MPTQSENQGHQVYGYRDKRTSTVYYNAAAQTDNKQPVLMDFKYFINSRLIQTPSVLMYPPVNVSVETDKNKETQMWRKDFYVSNLHDKIMEAGNYELYHKRQKVIYKILDPKPIVMEYKKKGILQIETQEDRFINELERWYNKYLKFDMKKEERITYLLDLKGFLSSLDEIEETLPITELLDEEISMLEINAKYMEGLRNRISFLMNNYIQTKTPLKKSDTNKMIFQCQSCQEFKETSCFSHGTSLNLKYCNSCAIRVNRTLCETEIPGLGPYMEMIQEIKNEEDFSGNHIPFLIKPIEIRILIQEIWGGSIVSGEKDPVLLSLPKWDRTLPWSPWNCIALTKHETKTHKIQTSLYLFYSKQFINEVISKHEKAQKYFKSFKTCERKNNKITYKRVCL